MLWSEQNFQALGEDLVNCLFSRNWSFRETGIKHLSKEIIATLLRSAGEGRSGAIISPTRQAATHAMLETSSKILAHMCGDPVYRVFVACLVGRSLSGDNSGFWNNKPIYYVDLLMAKESDNPHNILVLYFSKKKF